MAELTEVNVSVDGVYENLYSNKIDTVYFTNPKVYSDLSRYKNVWRILDPANNVFYHSLSFATSIPESSADRYITINYQHQARFDSIAEFYYGQSSYWWIIALANDKKDAFDIKIGDVIRVPPLASIYATNSVFK